MCVYIVVGSRLDARTHSMTYSSIVHTHIYIVLLCTNSLKKNCDGCKTVKTKMVVHYLWFDSYGQFLLMSIVLIPFNGFQYSNWIECDNKTKFTQMNDAEQAMNVLVIHRRHVEKKKKITDFVLQILLYLTYFAQQSPLEIG